MMKGTNREDSVLDRHIIRNHHLENLDETWTEVGVTITASIEARRG